MAPQLIFGAASLGMDKSAFQDAPSVQSLLQTLTELAIHRLDTAARYPPQNPGRSEELIGEVLGSPRGQQFRAQFRVDTKVYTDTARDGSGDLATDNLRRSVGNSLDRLGHPEPLNVLYSHRHDPGTSLEEQIEGFNEEIKKGHCESWGVSNTSPEVLAQILTLCEARGWQKPAYYQGKYNMITRGMETQLLPHLRAHGMKFVAFQVLGAGFLTAKFATDQASGTRFGDDHPLGKVVQGMFAQAGLKDAMRRFDGAVRARGLTPVEVAVRWAAHHSVLGEQDGMILGASRQEQLRETVGMLRKGPLEEEVVRLVEGLWEECRGEREGLV